MNKGKDIKVNPAEPDPQEDPQEDPQGDPQEEITDIISPAFKKTVLRSSLNVLKNDRSVRNIFGVFGVETSPEFKSAFRNVLYKKLDKIYKESNNAFDRIFVEILKKYF